MFIGQFFFFVVISRIINVCEFEKLKTSLLFYYESFAFKFARTIQICNIKVVQTRENKFISVIFFIKYFIFSYSE